MALHNNIIRYYLFVGILVVITAIIITSVVITLKCNVIGSKSLTARYG